MRKSALWIILVLVCTGTAYGDFFNNRNVLIGEQAALMGGAYTALSTDISGAYYNPAGLAFLPESALSLSASLYSYKNYLRESRVADEKLELQTFDLVPTTTGYAVPLGSFAFALSIFQIDSFAFSTLSINSDGSISKFEMESESYLMGPSVAVRLGDSFSLGVSAFYHFSKAKFVYFKDTGPSIAQNQLNSGGATFHAGAKWNITSEFMWGINYGTETVNLHGKNTFSTLNYIGPDTKGTNDGEVRLPHRVNSGFAFSLPGRMTIAFDAIYYFPLSYAAPNMGLHLFDADFTYRENAHWDFSLGGEYYVSGTVSLRAGVFTNTSGAPDFEKTEKVDCYGASFGLGINSEGFSSGIGVVAQYGNSGWQITNYTAEEARWRRLSIALVAGGTKKF